MADEVKKGSTQAPSSAAQRKRIKEIYGKELKKLKGKWDFKTYPAAGVVSQGKTQILYSKISSQLNSPNSSVNLGKDARTLRGTEIRQNIKDTIKKEIKDFEEKRFFPKEKYPLRIRGLSERTGYGADLIREVVDDLKKEGKLVFEEALEGDAAFGDLTDKELKLYNENYKTKTLGQMASELTNEPLTSQVFKNKYAQLYRRQTALLNKGIITKKEMGKINRRRKLTDEQRRVLNTKKGFGEYHKIQKRLMKLAPDVFGDIKSPSTLDSRLKSLLNFNKVATSTSLLPKEFLLSYEHFMGIGPGDTTNNPAALRKVGLVGRDYNWKTMGRGKGSLYRVAKEYLDTAQLELDSKNISRSKQALHKVNSIYTKVARNLGTISRNELPKYIIKNGKIIETNVDELIKPQTLKKSYDKFFRNIAGYADEKDIKRIEKAQPNVAKVMRLYKQGKNREAKTFITQRIGEIFDKAGRLIPKSKFLFPFAVGATAIGASLKAMTGDVRAEDQVSGAVDDGAGSVDQVSETVIEEPRTTDQETMTYNSTTGTFDNMEGDPVDQDGVLNWIADNPAKAGFAALPAWMGLGYGLSAAGMKKAGQHLMSWKAIIPAMMIPEKMYQWKSGMEAGEMVTDPFNALWALGIRNQKSLEAAKAYYDKLSPDQRISLKGLKTVEGWKNLPKGLRAAMMSPAATGTDLAFQKRLKPATKKLTEAIIGSPGAKQVAKKGLGALAKRVGIGLGAAALLPATVAAGLVSAPLTLGLGALSFGYAQYKDYRDGKAIVDSMRARGKLSEADADNYMSLIKQGSLPFGLGNRLFGDDEMTLRGQTVTPEQQRHLLAGMEDQIDVFQEGRRDVRALDRSDDFDFFNEGGRVGMKTGGGLDRRGFLKWLGALGATVIGGATGLLKHGWKAPAKQVVKEVAKETITTAQPEMWVPRLIAKIKAEGKLIEMADRKYVNGDIYEYTINGKKVTMESNPVTGNTEINWSAPDYDSEMTRSIHFNEGEIISEGNLAGQKTKPEVDFLEPDRSTPYRDDFESFDWVNDSDQVLDDMQKWIGVEDVNVKPTGPQTSNFDMEGYNWSPDDEFSQGGEVETGAIARRQSEVPPLSGPDPQGIMGLYSSPKQVRVG